MIVSADGKEVDQAEDLGRIISSLEPGKTVELEVVRDGKREVIEVTLEDRPTSIQIR